MQYRSYALLKPVRDGGIVMRARDIVSNIIVAVKFCKDRDKALKEVAALLMVQQHLNVIHLLDWYDTNDNIGIAIVMPLADMDLMDFIQTSMFTTVSTLRAVAEQVAAAVEHVHSCGLVHLDVKPDNVGVVLLESGGMMCKLMDFGSAQSELVTGTRIHCTRFYLAPEMLLGMVTPAADVYALGMTLRALIAQLAENTCGAAISAAFGELWRAMTREDYFARPTSGEVVLAVGMI